MLKKRGVRLIIFGLLLNIGVCVVGQDSLRAHQEMKLNEDTIVRLINLEDFPLATHHLYFGNISNDTTFSKSYLLYDRGNRSTEVLMGSLKKHSFVTVSFDSIRTVSGTNTLMNVAIDPIAMGRLGYHEFQFQFDLDSSGISIRKEFVIVTNVFEKLTISDEKSPQLIFDKDQHDFKNVSSGSTLTTPFILSNVGVEPLKITEISSNCDCVHWEIEKMQIAPASSAVLVVYFDTTNRYGNQYKSVSIFSNDPSAPVQVINLKARLERFD